jgi:hypothetical protein
MNSVGVFLLWVFLCLILAAGQVGGSSAAASVSICQIQDSGFTSPFNEVSVQTQGVVSADFDDDSAKGFFMQEDDCDSNPATSDGIFVHLGEKIDIVEVGERVEVSGTVAENYGRTEISAAAGQVKLLSKGNPLPGIVEMNPPFDKIQARAYFESLEGMLVNLPTANVVGPTGARDDTWVIRQDLGLARVFQCDPLGTGEIVCAGGEGHYQVEPSAKVGDQILGLSGVLDFSLGRYCMALLAQPSLIHGSVPATIMEPISSPGFTFATFNFNNLFDWIDDPDKDDEVLSESEYHKKLDKLALMIHFGMGEPAFIAVQEVENDIVLRHLLAREVIEAEYDFIWQEGPDRRGIDIALIYRLDQVSVMGFDQHQGCTQLADGLGPDGNRDPQDPQNEITCDTDGDGLLDGNRLFSRPPLVVKLQVALGDGESQALWVMINHWKSKLEDNDYQEYTLQRRVEQAQFVAALSNEIMHKHPGANLMIIGDLNDFPDSQPINILTQTGLRNVMVDIPEQQRYTFIYQGVSQVLDYALTSPSLAMHGIQSKPLHLNADFPTVYEGEALTAYRSSDHDPINFDLIFLSHQVYVPLVGR